MNFIKKIWDFFIKRLSIRYWRGRRLERLSLRYKPVDAKILEDICKCINPPYSDIVELARSVLGGGDMHSAKMKGGDFFNDSHIAEVFYHDRKKFLNKEYLNSIVGDISDSFHNFLMEHYSLAKEESEFKSRVAAEELQEHVLLSDDNVGRKTIEFKEINVQGDIKFNLGGKFSRWVFNRVKFGGDTTVNIFPPHSGYPLARMDFNENICNGIFFCLFAAVSEIYIGGNKLSAVYVNNPTIPDNGKTVSAWLERMIISCYEIPRLEFSKNEIEKVVTLYNGRKFHPDSFGLGDVRFIGGNYIGRLFLESALWPADELPNDDSGHRPPPAAKIRSFFFSHWEQIAPTSDMREARNCKDFFIAWKNQAKKIGDDGSVDRYTIHERYFDRMLGRSWLAKFPPWLPNSLSLILNKLFSK